MAWSLTNIVYVQPLAVLATSEPNATPAPLTESVGIQFQRMDSSVPEPHEIVPLNQVLRQTFSSTPVIWNSQLINEYRDLGEALGQMTELDEESEWRIEQPVYNAARFVARELMAHSFEAPRIFTHGPQSVVFNWPLENDNLYLTVSANKISALISSPQSIKARLDYSANQQLDSASILNSLRSAHLKQPVLMQTNSTSDPSEFEG